MPFKLLVGPFPSHITDSYKHDLLHHFHAIDIDILSKKNKSFVLGIFSSENDCEYALRNLHQLKLPKCRLTAKYYEKFQHGNDFERNRYNNQFASKRREDIPSKLNEAIKSYEANLCSTSLKYNTNFSIDPKLCYLYPPPSPTVLANITQSLTTNYKFYIQVLHLMNKMNLLCPFVDEDTDENYENVESGKTDYGISSSESELESEVEHTEKYTVKQKSHAIKRLSSKKKFLISKKPKFELLKQSLEKVVRPHGSTIKSMNVFEQVSAPNTKKLELKVVTTHLDSIADNILPQFGEGFGKICPPSIILKESITPLSCFISKRELEENRVNKEDFPIMPVFQNYKMGEPSRRLYIKNLAKTVTETDLKFIYGKFVDWNLPMDDERFTIRLMKEGRMKGQAFVTFSNEILAQEALDQTNGFIFKDKPIVVVFGRVKTVISKEPNS